jgi:hypothetical protein
MIGLEDRQSLSQDIEVAHSAGARLHLACAIAGIDLRTLQRWKAHDGLVAGDGRPQAVRPLPRHALSQAERAELLRVANEPRFAAVPPARIVPMLADEGVYLASESSFSRVLRAQGQSAHRGRAKAPRAVRAPSTHIATAACAVWCWDMTYLPASVIGLWFHLYLILDLYSRKIVGWEAARVKVAVALFCSRRLCIDALRMRLDDGVAFGVERHGADGRPVARGAGPARRVAFTGLGVQCVTRGQDCVVFAGVALRRADVANAAMAMVDVVRVGGRPILYT